jgi:hypothetical protein
VTDPNNTPDPTVIDGTNLTGSLFVSADQIQNVFTQEPPIIAVHGDDNTLMIAIHPDGHLEYGPSYQPDDAARLFWAAVEQHARNAQYGAPMNARVNAHLRAGEEAEHKVARLDQMATAWLERLPETIRTATAAEAVHHITRDGA